jgi:tetratricopeptide (TPR) repeat protein
MLGYEQHILPVDLLFDDDQIGDFVKSIQIDSPYQQMILEGVLTETVRDEKLYVSFTVEGYFHFVLGEVIYNQTKGKSPETLKKIVEENKLNGAKEGVEQCLILDVLVNDLSRLMWLIDEGEEQLELFVIPFLHSLKSHGVKKNIEKLLENPTENDWQSILKLDIQLEELQLHILRKDFLTEVMKFNPLKNKYSKLIALKAISILDDESSKFYFSKIDINSIIFQKDIDFLFQLGNYFFKIGEYLKSINQYDKCYLLNKKNQGDFHHFNSIIKLKMGNAYFRHNDSLNSILNYQTAMEIMLKCYGKFNIKIGDVINNIGAIKFKQKDYDKALILFRSSLKIRIKNVGKYHVLVSNSYNNIGTAIMNKKDNNEKALYYYKKSLNIRLKILGNDSNEVGVMYSKIGLLLKENEKYEKALVYFQKHLNLRLKNFGDQDLSILNTYFNIGDCLYKIKNYEKSIKILSIGFSIQKKHYFPLKIGQNYEALKQKEIALNYYLKAAELQNKQGQKKIPSQEAFANVKRLAKELNKESELPEWMNL